MTEQQIRRFLRQIGQEHSQTALRNFFEMCYDRFFRIAYFFLHREDWAQEVVVDVFFKVWERRLTLSHIQNLEDYFFIMLKNASLDFLSREEKYGEGGNAEMRSLEQSPEEKMILEELFSAYVKALDRLPERCRAVFILVREEKKSYSEVAGQLGISVKTVDAQLQKAQNRLKEMLFPEND